MLLNQIKHLIAKEILVEWRQKYAFNGILLYIASTVFVCYLSFKNIIDPPTWNALFWIIMLFVSVNAIAKSFVQENSARQLYIYTLVSPQAIILSKMIYNSILMIFLSLVCFGFYSLFIGYIVQDTLLFLVTLILGSMGFSTVLTMVSAIAAKTNNNATLMAILSFPMLIPLLMIVIKVSKNAVDGLDRSVSYDYMLILMLLNLIVVILSYLLFPYLWRD
ncbi:MAG: heme exporter protein CcmB [Bacteroidetes bacterium]|nr:heme exporter protein CcmB [Bacteroidota bacterium]